MGSAEIIPQVDSLSSAEREKLATHLRALNILDDPDYFTEIGRRAEELERGENCLSPEELMAKLRQLGRAV